jgi:hypothetical protein
MTNDEVACVLAVFLLSGATIVVVPSNIDGLDHEKIMAMQLPQPLTKQKT